MNKYQLSKIYKISPINYNKDDNDVYYGSTIQKYLSYRLALHKNHYKNYLLGKRSYITSFELFEKYGLNGVEITLIENYPCNSKDELISRERYYIQNNNCINKHLPGRNKKEYFENYKDHLKEKQKINYVENKEHYKEYKKNYYINNKEKIEKKEVCECGGKYTLYSKAKHTKTNKHLNYINK